MAAEPCSHAPTDAASKQSSPAASRVAVEPGRAHLRRRRSPATATPVVLTRTRPSGLAITALGPFRSTTAFHRFAAVVAASSIRPRRRHAPGRASCASSPACGVRTTGPLHLSGRPDKPSASTSVGRPSASTRLTFSPWPWPRPGPTTQACTRPSPITTSGCRLRTRESARTLVADHPRETGGHRRRGDEQAGPRVLGRPGFDAEDAAGVLLGVMSRGRQQPTHVVDLQYLERRLTEVRAQADVDELDRTRRRPPPGRRTARSCGSRT